MCWTLRMYANEHDGAFPAASRRWNSGPGRGKFDGEDLYPEYVTYPKVVVCPSDATADASELERIFELIEAGDPDGVLENSGLEKYATRRVDMTRIWRDLPGRKSAWVAITLFL